PNRVEVDFRRWLSITWADIVAHHDPEERRKQRAAVPAWTTPKESDSPIPVTGRCTSPNTALLGKGLPAPRAPRVAHQRADL
ncbi:MAG: hypothetical protein M3325_08060, partial [Actinomycetota bacterium]|nr:hypothetical protein [Actinomycetota bacterium]